MKKITCFIATMSSGGAEHQLAELTAMLAEKGYAVSIVTFGDTKDHYVIDKHIKRVRLAYNKGYILKYLAILKYFFTVHTDCIISFGQRENMFMLLPLLFRRNVAVIAGERNFTTGKSSRIEKLLLNFLYRRANYIVPNSYSQKKHIIGKKPELASKVTTITNYTDLESFLPVMHPRNEIVRMVVFCRYSQQKNYERFAEAINLVKNRVSTPFIVDWYGNMAVKDTSLNPHYLHFVELIKNNNLEDVIRLHDHTKDVYNIMSRADVFCLPSLFEGFSNSLSEAICCGLPILASDVSDNSVMTHDGVNGFLFDPYNVDSIANAIIRYLSLSIEEQNKMAIKSREIAITLFNKEEFVNKYISLIES